MIASTPAIAAIGFSRSSASGPMTPMITRDAPLLICASSPNSRTRVMIRWICSSVALGWVITIIYFVRDHQNDAGRNFLQAQYWYSALRVPRKRRSSAALQNASVCHGARKLGHVLECASALALLEFGQSAGFRSSVRRDTGAAYDLVCNRDRRSD